MIAEIVAVRFQPEYHLLREYTNGGARLFDATPYFARGVITWLKEQKLFAQARIELGKVTWWAKLDIAPETLILQSQPQVCCKA